MKKGSATMLAEVEKPGDDTQTETADELKSVLADLIADVEAKAAEDLPTAIRDASDEREFQSLKLGGFLERADKLELWKVGKSHETFLDWCEHVCGIEAGRSQRLRRAYRAVSASGLNLAELSDLGFYKVSVLLPRVLEPLPNPVVPTHKVNASARKNNAQWLEKAKNLSRSELAAAIEKAKGGGKTSHETPKAKPVTVTFHADQSETLEAAAELAAKKFPQLKGKDKAQVVDAIVQDWASVQDGKPAAPTVTKPNTEATLPALMKEAGPMAVLAEFDKLWPEIPVQATFTEGE